MSTKTEWIAQKGDRLSYIGKRGSRRTGIAKGWRDGKVIVLHKAGYTELIAQSKLTPITPACPPAPLT